MGVSLVDGGVITPERTKKRRRILGVFDMVHLINLGFPGRKKIFLY